MRIQFASDLHLEFFQKDFPDFRGVEPADSDVLVLAGDIANGSRVFELFGDWHCPVIFVPGNHEFYGASLPKVLSDFQERAARYPNVTVLNGTQAVISGVRFVGGTLWTDYELFGKERRDEAMFACAGKIHDHAVIEGKGGTAFRPADARDEHLLQRQQIESTLSVPFVGKSVLVTHHAPHRRSVHPQYAADITSTAFASHLAHIVELADLCIHGHVHSNFDYTVGKTRVVANPLGYCHGMSKASHVGELKRENAGFDPQRVISI